MIQAAHGASRQLQLGDEEQIDERLARRAHELEGRLAKFGTAGIPALNDATSGGTASGSMDPPRETKRASFSKVGLFRSCAPDRPNLEKRRVKAGPTQISKQISRNLGQGQLGDWQHKQQHKQRNSIHSMNSINRTGDTN